ncbi:DUF433 domain-containing protein [Phragmitibacter flavus]|uniref:DUF433 domain-containing protein n=1 Tax=Phragmitibacter flavus TaxID=2576071 RepID=A0A5R8KCZ7_9BACT|nr:DUF433 domain-containing protein [Phragmitibacter flavus]TLD70178.1 DUF433 domain-containing protein [Phragmitibacter flavus]
MIEFDWSECPAVWRDPERMGGLWCFDQTRLPISYLFENLGRGVTLEEFVDWYPPVTMEHCRAVLEFAAQRSAERGIPELASA